MSETEHSLAEEKAALDTERRRNAILQVRGASEGSGDGTRTTYVNEQTVRMCAVRLLFHHSETSQWCSLE